MRTTDEIIHNGQTLTEILRLHKCWRIGKDEGERANLSGTNLSNSDLSNSDLSDSDLSGTNLSNSNLSGTNLSNSDLSNSDLSDSDLSGTNLSNSNLSGTNLSNSDLSGTNLRGTNLSGTSLSGTNYNENTAFFALQCPEDGAFIAWKKLQKGLIAKLMIPEDAKRSSATTRKCRSSKAIVISIFDCDGKEVDKGFSSRNSSFVYEKGKEVLPHDFDDDRWKECSGGIHFFITKQEAINYN